MDEPVSQKQQDVRALISLTRELSSAVNRLRFSPPVTHVYNPLDYAREPHELYLQRFGANDDGPRVLFVGMNPGPFGMAQTGVPFGDIKLVRDWLGISGAVSPPQKQHPARPIQGFACPRSEVSGTRFWGWARQRFETPARFFARFFVVNYCPLVFMDQTGRNVTPDKLPVEERRPLFALCDRALRSMVERLTPSHVIGVGGFAERRATEALAGLPVEIACILHPSPANPAANRDWCGTVDKQLMAHGISVEQSHLGFQKSVLSDDRKTNAL